MGLKITITDSTPTTTTLCDSPDPLPTAELRINGKSLLQVEELFQAAEVVVFDRLNRTRRVSFQTTRNKDSSGTAFTGAGAALTWLMDHLEALPGTGLITLTVTDVVGTPLVRYMTAGIESVELVKQTGVSLRLQYTLVGGKFRTSA